MQISIMAKPILLGLIGGLLMACVPAVVKVYDAPLIYGQLLEKDTLEPVAGVKLQHQHPKALPVYSDEQGYFQLPSISSYQGVVLMPAHALKEYNFTLTIDGRDFNETVDASMLMRSEEIRFAPLLIANDRPFSRTSNLLPENLFERMTIVLGEQVINTHCDVTKLRDGLLLAANLHQQFEIPIEESSIEHRLVTVYPRMQADWKSCLQALQVAPLESYFQSDADRFMQYLSESSRRLVSAKASE
ncbi:MAG: hypothetical protein CL693_16850 [Cellvibrionaceae bacterium]|nr:hypothetical protein [Cellvibrionaceae bacterium]|tara:strand:- start:6682 stop:7416 length:735 start_codon:yes stop_codon:yes gene_type:complete